MLFDLNRDRLPQRPSEGMRLRQLAIVPILLRRPPCNVNAVAARDVLGGRVSEQARYGSLILHSAVLNPAVLP